jgi:hypothetical protein
VNYIVRCKSVMESGEVLITHTEVSSDCWTSEREAVASALRSGVQWYAAQNDETPVGDIEYIVHESGFPPSEIERGMLT